MSFLEDAFKALRGDSSDLTNDIRPKSSMPTRSPRHFGGNLLKDSLGTMGGSAEAKGGLFKDLRGYKDGTDYVPEDGPAMLHEGEAVIPADQNPHNPDKEEPMATEKKHDVSLYRAMHHLNKGGLHRALNVPEGENIPAAKLAAAKHSTNAHVAHMAHFAGTMKGFKK